MIASTEKKVWYYKSTGFTVEITTWRSIDSKVENHWNVYAHILRGHPIFGKIVNEKLWDYGENLPLHGGASFHRWTHDSTGDVIKKTIGSDYAHLHDDRFEGYATEQEAWEVFRDAEELYRYLKEAEEEAEA